MRNRRAVFAAILLGFLIYYSFYSLMPKSGGPQAAPISEFSTHRAVALLEKISKKPHFHGSDEHDRVRAVLIAELTKLGLSPEVQEGFVYNTQTRGLTQPANIVARMEGSEGKDALLLLSHYDSALVPSPGASDAGSGLVTILESLRAFKARGELPENDIIVLFTDAEEIGLDGASLFVNEHRWASDVKLVLNFEARGSGGPSNMIVETNGGNTKLIKAFSEAKLTHPVASSLMYSVYKLLPNDTDSTIFREEGDIDSFFFAFIDDHFDYHTSNDTVANLDIETLQHQGNYLLPLLTYFANANLDALKSGEDSVYVNIAPLGMIHYPFAYIFPMLLVAFVLFFIVVNYGFRKQKITWNAIGYGFLALLIALLASTLLGYFGWAFLESIYPQYGEIQHGFKYNGHDYIAFFVLLSLAITLWIYQLLGKNKKVAGMYVAPIFVWLLVNTAVLLYLKGAAYFIIPVYFALLSLWLLIKQKKPNPIMLALLGAPAILLFAPLIQFFPVGLGSDHVFISCLFTVLLFGLLYSVFAFFPGKKWLAAISLTAAIGFFLSAHWDSSFSEERQKPNSLVYYLDTDTGTAYWLTFDKLLDSWTQQYLGKEPFVAAQVIEGASGSKYGKNYTYAARAGKREVPSSEITLVEDTVFNNIRHVRFLLTPKRRINQLNLYADTSYSFKSLIFNGKPVPADSTGFVSKARQRDNLLRYWVDNRDSLEVAYTIAPSENVAFTIREFSFDLLENSQFKIRPRPAEMMPKPFVTTDAIITNKSFHIDSLKLKNPQLPNDYAKSE